jgi:C4-dicarboxylate transporter
MYIGWIFAFLCNLIFTKGDKKKLFNDGHIYLESMGKALGYTGALLICANVFSAGVTLIGGLEVIINNLTGGTGGGAALLVAGALVTVMYAISIAVTGSANANIATFATMIAGMAKGPQFTQMVSMLIPGGCLGANLSPISGVTIIVTGNTGLGIPRVIKRLAIPSILGTATAILAAIIIL